MRILAAFLVTIILAILGALAGCFIALWVGGDYEWGFVLLLICIPIGAAGGAAIGFMVSTKVIIGIDTTASGKALAALLTIIFAILGGLAGCYVGVLQAGDSEWGLIYLLMDIPIGAAVGAAIGPLLFYLVCEYWRRD
jgi:hypothetical protein